jgi:autotransporter translocation and assembly factor TamB
LSFRRLDSIEEIETGIVKKSLKVLAIALLVILAGGIGSGLWFIRTDSFQEFVRTVLISKVEKATGLNCSIERIRVDIFRGRIDMTGLALEPKTAAPGLATLRAHEVRAVVSISSFWHFRVRLADLNVVSPQVEFTSSEEESAWSPEKLLSTIKMSLRLEASRVVVQDGRIKINKRIAPFHLSLDDLDCEIRYTGKTPSYKINVGYKRSTIFWERRDITHNLEVVADLSHQGIEIEYFKLSRGDSLFTGSGSFRNWESPVLLLKTAGVLDSRDLKLAHSSLYEGRGTIGVLASIRHDRNGFYSKGKFSARAGGYRKMTFSNLAGDYEIQRDVLSLRNTSGRVGKGSFLANGDIQLRDANKDPNRVKIVAREVPVIEAGRLLKLPLLNFENAADASALIAWYAGKPLNAEIDAHLYGLAQPATVAGRSVLLEGPIRFTYVEMGDVQITSANLKSPYTSVQASGGQDALFHVQLSTNHISEPLSLVAGLSPPMADLLTRQPDLPRMSGAFAFEGDVRIKSASDIEYRGSVSVRNGRWRSYQVDALTAQASFSSSRLEMQSIKIANGSQRMEGEAELEFAEQEQLSIFAFKGNAHQIPLASLKMFGVDTAGINGIGSGSGSIKYDHGIWEGDGRISIEKGNYNGEVFDSLSAQLRLGNRRLDLIRVEASRGASRLNAEGLYDLKTGNLNIATSVLGLSLEELPVVLERHLPIRGRISASGTLTGTPQKPAFNGIFKSDLLRYDRWNIGKGEGRIGFENGTVQGAADIHSDFGRMEVQARISTSAGYPVNATVQFGDLDIHKIIPAKPPQFLREISTALKGKVEIEGKLADLAALEVRGEVDGAHFKIQDYEMRNAGRMQFAIRNRDFLIGNMRFEGDGTSLALSGSIPFDDNRPLDLDLNGNLNVRLLQGIEKRLNTGGSAALSIHASGSRQNPQVVGRASIKEVLVDHPDFPFKLSEMQGDIVFSRNLVRLENVHGEAASGKIQLSGAIEHQNAVLRSVNMSISLQNARLVYPRDFPSVVNADLTLSGTGDAQILGGDVDVIRMDYVRNLSLLEQIASRGAIQSGPLTTAPYLLGLRLNVEIHSNNGFYIDNELTNLRGSLRLALSGTPAYPSLTGRVEVSEGTIFFRGSRFQISRAAVNFIDRNRINPVLEIRAEADVRTYRLILDVGGDLEHLNMNVTSDPPMSTVDILSLLTTGKSDTGFVTSQRESQITGLSAASVLSENLTGVLGKRVQRIFGLESFRVDPFLAGTDNDPTARVTISERVSKDLIVTYSRNLNTQTEQIIVIEYDIGKNLSVVATQDENGEYGLDFRFRKRLR